MSTLRRNSIILCFQVFIFSLSLNNWPIKFTFLSEKRKMQRLTVNLNIWVKSNKLRQDHGWKSWFCSIVIYPFYENILIKRWKFEGMSLFISILFLPKCLPIENNGIIFQSSKSSSNNLFTQEYCMLVILFFKSKFFIPPFSVVDPRFNFKVCATSGEAASINGTRGLGVFWAPEANAFRAI